MFAQEVSSLKGNSEWLHRQVQSLQDSELWLQYQVAIPGWQAE